MPPHSTHTADSTGLVLGFDARESWLSDPGGWDRERRDRYLLRLDVRKPLSMDRAVWGSIFDLRPDLVPAYTGPLAGLWEDLGRLEACLATEERTWRRVAFTLSAMPADEERLALDDFLHGVDSAGVPVERAPSARLSTPSTVDATWEFLGYDVVDLAGTSGLSNMGFLPGYDDADALRSRWGPHLNDAHLFSDRAQAEAFKSFSCTRVPEHSPFHVVGLWDVPRAE